MSEHAGDSVDVRAGAVVLAPGTCMCCVYRGSSEQHDALMPFLSAVLEVGRTRFAARSDHELID